MRPPGSFRQRAQRQRPAAVAVVHLPPPLHGLATASRSVVDALEGAAAAPIAVADIRGAIPLTPTAGILRVLRFARAAVAILRHRRCKRLYLACDGGAGAAFTAMLLGLAGRLGYTVHLHHHSLAPFQLPQGNTAARLARAARTHREHVVHIGACQCMLDEIIEVYGAGTRTVVLPLHHVAEATAPLPRREAPHGRLVLGHMANLTAAKGLGEVFALLDAGVAQGLDLELVIAGPVLASPDRQLLERGLAGAGDRARWLGPVSGASKAAFFDQIDVFVFPSRHVHESFAIVVAEAQEAGKPVLAYQAGCLHAAVFGPGVHTYPMDADFVASALPQLRSWSSDRSHLAQLSAEAAQQAHRNRAAADRALADLVSQVLGP